MSTEPQGPGVSNAQWDSRSVGRRWQQAFFATLIRIGGRRPAYACMYLVVLWYVLLRPFVRRRCRYYLDRRFPDVTNPLIRLWHDYRRIVALGGSLIDRGAFGLLGPGTLKVEFPEGRDLQALVDEGRGLIVLNSHVGCWQVAMSAFSYLHVPVSIVMHQRAGDIDPRWFQRAGEEAGLSIIDPAKNMGGIMEMIGTLKRREILGLMADRVFGDDPNTLEATFLGAPVHFPVSPYRLASMQGTPVAVVFSYKTGFSTYRIQLARVIRVPTGLGRSNEAYVPYLQEFVAALETFVQSHPWQFFNFHDMWQQST
ncbi:lysophospholipid acyltransferase family protein [Anaerobaca lacustris]|uniref:Lysophospholipid acyltransferase family protein n=1 Tax=Anaerobaca lacustris TaxID=3044600 RepID=A0AAW6TVG2_9BACT|nr:lysophospholipid acyltransferase family protein [Sedimentisphaerales bacterium M17dextr]